MLPYLLALFVAAQSAAQPAPHDEIKEGLARAEALYYEARFNESIKLLAGLHEVLEARPDRLQDRITAKLQLALVNIGLNDTVAAKILLGQIYALDADYVLDSKQFSPKVIALANDAKNEQRQIRCQKAGADARRHLANRDGAATVELLRSTKPKCPELAQIEPEAADTFYKQGLADYKQGNFLGALQAFQTTLKIAPSHEFATQYLDLTQNKLQLAEDRLLMQWQKNFDARLYKDAAADYRAMRSYGDVGNAVALNLATAQYRKALLPLVESWTRACASGDTAAVTNIKNQVTELLPDASFAGDLQSKMGPCTPPEPKTPETPRVASRTEPPRVTPLANRTAEPRPQPKATPTPSCFQMEAAAALTRLKARVEPQIPRGVLPFLQNSEVLVRVKVRIDESGNVTVGETTGSNIALNNSVRDAVAQWKFSPALGDSGPRCVDTELVVAIGRH
jgi:tetratricopeptide (TPR) repeat protein